MRLHIVTNCQCDSTTNLIWIWTLMNALYYMIIGSLPRTTQFNRMRWRQIFVKLDIEPQEMKADWCMSSATITHCTSRVQWQKEAKTLYGQSPSSSNMCDPLISWHQANCQEKRDTGSPNYWENQNFHGYWESKFKVFITLHGLLLQMEYLMNFWSRFGNQI